MSAEPCRNLECPNLVAKMNDAYFITMGHPGFNTPVNNALGYTNEKSAVMAVYMHMGRPLENATMRIKSSVGFTYKRGKYRAFGEYDTREQAEAPLAKVAMHDELVATLAAIYNADRTGNNGAYAGEATLCPAFSNRAKAILVKAKAVRS
jgi:hypothetical protein